MNTDVTTARYRARTILNSPDPDDGTEVEGWADMSYEAIRGMCHITMGAVIPAPTAYRVLGNLSGASHMLAQLVDQLGQGLARSLDDPTVYDDKRSPAESVAEATDKLTEAATLARRLGELLDEAQVAINSQGYGRPTT